MAGEVVEIISLGSSGEGIGVLASGKKIFVDSQVIPGEICRVEITQEKNKFARGRCIELMTSSPERVLPFGTEIPGANLAHMSYKTQLKYKQDKVRDCLIRLGGVAPSAADGVMNDIVPSDKDSNYRNHMQYSVRDGRLCLKAHGTGKDVQVDRSVLEYEMFGKVREAIEAAFAGYPTRLFGGAVIRGSERTGEILIELVSFSDAPSEVLIRDASEYISASGLAGRLSQLNLAGITFRISNTATEKRTRGGKRVVLYGNDYYTEILCGREFKVKSGAFFQVNVPQAEVLYGLARPDRYTGSLWDLYCGTGTVGLSLVKEGHKVMGVDISPEAIASARDNASRFGIDAEFICRPASKITTLLTRITHDDAVVVDPPRAGLDFSLVRSLIEQKPACISYISCDPSTLARDLKMLSDGGYVIESVTPVDMFPQTSHVEAVVLLSKLSSAPKLEVKINMSDLDLTEAEAKATYDEIQEYVKEQTGLHVTHLNIAQIKRKHGIIERANYNLPKSEKSRQPNCPPEKEKAIVAALKHFKMID